MKKKKVKSLRQLKDQCWKLFSEYIRRKDADEGGTVSCITCDRLMFWKESQCGHFIPGRTASVLFVEEICYPQCMQCNVFLRGAYSAYTLKMIDIHGRDWVEEKMTLKNKTVKLTRVDMIEKIEYYKEKLKEIGCD